MNDDPIEYKVPKESKNHDGVIIDPFTGERIFLPDIAEKINADIERNQTRGKPDGVWSYEEFSKALEASKNTGFNIISRLRTQLAASEPYAEYLGLQIPSDAIVAYLDEGASKITYGIQRHCGEKIAVVYKKLRGEAKGKPEGYWSTLELGEAIKAVNPQITDAGATGRSVVAHLRTQLETSELSNYRGVPVPKEAIAAYDYNNRPAYAIRCEEGQKIVEACAEKYTAKKDKPAGYWSAKEFSLAIRRHHPGVNSHGAIADSIMSILRSQLEIKDSATYKNIPVAKEAIIEYEYNSKSAYAIREEAGEKLAIAYTPERGAPAGYWSSERLGKAIKKAQPHIQDGRGTASRIISKIIQQHQNEEFADYKGVPIPKIAIAYYEHKGRPAHAIREKEAKETVAIYVATEEHGVPNGYWSSARLGEAINEIMPLADPTSYASGVITSIRQEHAEKVNAIFQGVPVSKEDITDYKYKGKVCNAIREEKGSQIAASYEEDRGVPQGYCSGKTLGEALKTGAPEIADARATGKMVIGEIRKQHLNGAATYKGITVPIEAVKQYGYGKSVSYSLRQQEADQIIAVWNTYERKLAEAPAGYWSAREFGGIILGLMQERNLTAANDEQTTGTGIISFLRKKLASKNEGVYKGIPISPDTIKEYSGGNGRSAYAIRQEEGELIAEAYVAERQAQPSSTTKPGAKMEKEGPVKPGALAEEVVEELQKRKQKRSTVKG